ncbi:hypothetical protein BT69DRAFT_1276723 [Atractiella rhizophila]|nr:hypothetical protein BT69DRAFT_1276723 [Atractiella rhizophila]
MSVCTPGESIGTMSAFLRGHGTYTVEEEIRASVVGVSERTNRLVTVKNLRSRYRPELGDLVVGRITQVQPGSKRWKVDCAARQEAVLMLSSINLPGGIQRKKQASDELSMREFFKEGDLLVCEVQAFFGDGVMSLHTRSLKYGKLRNGRMLSLPPQLIPRLPSHFITLPKPIDVDLILGLNGYAWVCRPGSFLSDDIKAKEALFGDDKTLETTEIYSSKNHPSISTDAGVHYRISKVSAILTLFRDYGMVVSIDRITAAWNAGDDHSSMEVDGKGGPNDEERLRLKDLWERGSEVGRQTIAFILAAEKGSL